VDDAAWEEELWQRAQGLAYGVAEVQVRRELGLTGFCSDHALIEKRAAQLQTAYGERFTTAVQALVDCQCEHCRHGDGHSAYCREDKRIHNEFAAQMNAQPEALCSGKHKETIR
jgi:hypothetical protein